MDHEREEVIKHQMLETRAALAEKLATLEQQIIGTVHSTTIAVTDTVESVKGAVQSVVEMAKATAQDTVEAMTQAFDISRHVRQHPWLMFGGSVILGYAGGCLLNRAETGITGPSSVSSFGPCSRTEPNGVLGGSGAKEPSFARSESTSAARVLGDRGQKFETEINKLKGLALGAVFGVVREVIANSAAHRLSSDLAEIIDSATVKLGGQPIHGPLLNTVRHESAQARTSSAVMFDERQPRAADG